MKDDDEHHNEIDDFDPHAERKSVELGAIGAQKFVTRGEEINLKYLDPSLNETIAAVGWDFKQFDRDPPDMDVSVFLLNRHEKTREDTDFIFYNNLTGCDGAVRHMGDSRTGAGDGDDETIFIDLNALPFDVLKIVFVVSIYDLDLTDNSFDQVKNVYFRLVNKDTNHELFRFNLDENLEAGKTSLLVGEMERVGSEWVFRAIGDTAEGGLSAVANEYGIIVAQMIVPT
ncbi:MAG: TerD family protein [Rhodospirillales bacterium]|nr:TerD family protein [Alphaproteobacteria bacterium]USO04236.1 MAG: TerD family protein [Rhodospirillales bacterium]